MVLMSEQPERALTPLSSPEQVVNSVKPVRKDSRGIQSTSEAENGGEDRPKRSASGRSAGATQLSVDTESDMSETRKKPPLMRFKAVEQLSPMQTQSDSETKFEGRKKSQSSQISKTNAQYHKIFKEISKDELLKQSYTCALQKDMLYQGKMFVSDNWICFHSKVFGKDTKIAIPVLSVTYIKKTKTAILVPNALVITTTNERHVFASFLSRDTTYKLLKSICVHLDGDHTGGSLITSSAENSFSGECSSSLPLVFSGDFSDLDGVVRQRRQDMLESSSSGSQTPDYEKMADFPSIPDTFLSAMKNGEVAVHADIHLQTPNQKHAAGHQNGPTKPIQGVVHKVKSLQPVSLNTLLLVYLFLVIVLVLSSCYMAFKIVALEKRLNSLGPMGEYAHNENVVHHRSQANFNAEMYGELSTNLFKLEKIQRNLRKLLEET
ncbi:GRAM domain-containing protein 2B [Esox lucius]|uniref:GRAM domain-containing protein n=1 Tax=Esox lucius TaxID=8010 RepID=A0A3P8ZNN8_ESOLU|nr:GRAM domain-containing protein 2B [Esox lucius]